MISDDEPEAKRPAVSQATSATITVVTPSTMISSLSLSSSQPKVIQTISPGTLTLASAGAGAPRLQVVRLVTPGGQRTLQVATRQLPVVSKPETIRLINSASVNAKLPIPASPSKQQRPAPAQRLILPASSVGSAAQIVTIPVSQHTTNLQTALATGPTGTTIIRQPTTSGQQVIAFLSPQKQQQQTAQIKTVIPQIKARVMLQSSAPSVTLAEPVVKQEVPVVVKKEVVADDKQRKPCNCTKSQCLKLYCDCFANGEFCSNCNCVSCANNLENEEQRQKAIKQCLLRNPHAFHPKIGKGESAEVRRHQKGCNCKRSGCLKNYCECFEAKITCGSMCKCVGCKNCEDNGGGKSLMNLADAAMVRTMQQTSASERLAEPLPSLTASMDSSKTREALKSTLTGAVIQGVLDCLLTQCREAEAARCKQDTTEKVIIEEFGRCLSRIIQSSTVNHKT